MTRLCKLLDNHFMNDYKIVKVLDNVTIMQLDDKKKNH